MKPHARSLRRVGPVLVFAVFVAGCGSQSAESTAPTSSSASREVIGAELKVNQTNAVITFANYFTSISDMKKQSDVVGVFEVVGSREGDVTGKMPDITTVQRLLELRVVDRFKGDVNPGTNVDLWNGTIKEIPQTGERRLSVTTPGWDPRIGDRVLLGLLHGKRYPNVFGTSSDAAYLSLIHI